MPYKVVLGDILEQDVNAVVVPHLAHNDIVPPLTRRIYDEAGYQNMIIEYSMAEIEAQKRIYGKFVMENPAVDPHTLSRWERPPIVAVTSGMGLRQKYAIHIRFEAESWWNGQPDSERTEKLYILSRCYHAIMDCAFKELKVRTVAAPLLGTDILGYPPELVRLTAEKTIEEWFRQNSPAPPERLRDSLVKQSQWINDHQGKIFIVIPPKLPKPKSVMPVDIIFSRYETQLREKIKSSGLDREAFFRNTCYEYLKRIDNDSEMAETLGFGSEVIHRFRAKQMSGAKGRPPKKWRVIALAVGMELDDYERFEFIRCSGYKYPEDELDHLVEDIISSGVRGFREINKRLCDLDPEYDLTKPAKRQNSIDI